MEEEAPDQYGTYEVMKRQGKYHSVTDEYLWNGAYWVTKKGSPTKAVFAWKKGA